LQLHSQLHEKKIFKITAHYISVHQHYLAICLDLCKRFTSRNVLTQAVQILTSFKLPAAEEKLHDDNASC